MVGEIEPRGLFETFVPELVPQDRDTNQLVADKQSLLDDDGAVLLHAVHDVERGLLPNGTRRLRRDGEGIDESLRMVLANFRE